ncbi:MAG: heavy-metal-associated domain-containing protein [Gemmatimonadaceae bacterium]
MEQITIPVSGMSCGHCVKAVGDALRQVAGVAVEGVTIGSATVSYDPAVAGPAAISRAIVEAGYVPGDGTTPQAQLGRRAH